MAGLIDLGFVIDLESAKISQDRIVRAQLGAGTRAVADTTKEVERAFEAATREAVPGRLWRAWASESYPKSGPARNPAGEVFVNGGARAKGAMKFWTEPGRIKGKSGNWLAIPLPAAGSRGRLRNLTPGEWERQNGKRLRFVFRPGRSALLVADVATTNRRTGVYRPITRARTKADERRGFVRGEQSVPIFVLVPVVAHRNTVSIESIRAAAPGRLAARFNEYSATAQGG